MKRRWLQVPRHHRKWWIRGVLLLSVVGIWGGAQVSGGALALSSAFGFCVLIAGWNEGVAGAIGMVLVGLLADHVSTRGTSSLEAVNEAVRSAFWLAAGVLAATLRTAREEAERQQKALRTVFERMRGDLDAAELVQSTLLRRPLPVDARLDLALHHATARVLGGDYFEIVPARDRVLLCIADVSGKGPPAAMVTTYFRGLLEEVAARDPSPGRVLQTLNRQLVPSLPDSMFLTCFYGVLDLRGGLLTYASAGHDPPLLLRAGDSNVTNLMPTGIPLGILAQETYRETTISVGPGDRLLLYTDGMTAVSTPEGRRLQDEDVAGVLRTARGESNAELIERLLDLSPTLRHGDLQDDVLLVLLTIPLPEAMLG